MLSQGTAFGASIPYTGPNTDGGSLTLNGQQSWWDLEGDTFANPVSLECVVWQQENTPATQYLMLLIQSTNVAAALYLASGIPTLQGTGATRAAPASRISRQVWHHVVGTVDAAGNGKLYVDAIQVATAVVGAGGSHPYQLVVGSTASPAGSFLSGSISECAVYTTALSPTQINNHFLALNNTSSRPVYVPNGIWTPSNGGITPDTSLLTQILKAVQRTFPTT